MTKEGRGQQACPPRVISYALGETGPILGGCSLKKEQSVSGDTSRRGSGVASKTRSLLSSDFSLRRGDLATHGLQILAVTLTDRRREQAHLPWQMSHPIADDAHELILLLNKGKVTTLLKNDQLGARDAPMEAFCTQRWRRNPVVLTTKNQRRR
jgi:hypothetical protein